MPDNTTTSEATVPAKAPEVPAVPVVTIERNGVSLVFSRTGYQRDPMKSSGITFAYPHDADNVLPLTQLVQFIGEDNVREILTSKLALLCQSWSWEASQTKIDPTTKEEVLDGDKNTPHNLEEFTKFVQTFSARGEGMKVLQQRQNDLLMKLPSVKDPAEAQKLIAQAVALAQAIESKKRKTD